MAVIQIRGRSVDVNIEHELSRFTWHRAKWTANRLLSCSPFRYDSSPSFYVYLDDTATAFAGSWGDSGGNDWKKGHFTQLLSFLMDCTEEEVVEYLLSEYASEWDGEEELVLNMEGLRPKQDKLYLDPSLLENFTGTSDYLRGRGISNGVQALYNVAYDKAKNVVMFPYVLPNGRLAALKYRRTDSKIFFYEKGGVPMRELIYGIDLVYRENVRTVIVTEAEIDAMYATTATGTLGIGVGTSSLTDEKASVIKRSSIEQVIIASDNDAAGEKLKAQICGKLRGFVDLYEIELPTGKKDLNDCSIEEVQQIIERKKAIVPALFTA